MKEFEVIPYNDEVEDSFFTYDSQTAIVFIIQFLKNDFELYIDDKDYMKISNTLNSAIKENRKSIKFRPKDFSESSPYDGFIKCNITEIDNEDTLYLTTRTCQAFYPITVNDCNSAIGIINNYIRANVMKWSYDYPARMDIPLNSLNIHLASCINSAIANRQPYILFRIDYDFVICCKIIQYWDEGLRTKYLITAYEDDNMSFRDSMEELLDDLHKDYNLNRETIKETLKTNESEYEFSYSFKRSPTWECKGNVTVFVINSKAGRYCTIGSER